MGRFRALIVLKRVGSGVWTREGLIGQSRSLTGLGKGEPLAFPVEDQFGIIDESHAMRLGELLGSGADEVDVGTLFKHQPGGLDGIAQPLDAGYAARFHPTSIHEQGIELYAAIRGEKAASASVEGRVVLQYSDGGFDCIESRTSSREKVVAGFQRVADAVFVGFGSFGGDSPCAAVNQQGGEVFRSRVH